MYSKTFKIEQLKDGNWVGIGASFFGRCKDNKA